MAEEILAEGFKDAIHVPFVVVTGASHVFPGEKCRLEGGKAVRELHDWWGVVDPFLTSFHPVEPGTPFRLFLRPGLTTPVRHDFDVVPPGPKLPPLPPAPPAADGEEEGEDEGYGGWESCSC